jgi:hypothetical protein
MTRNECLINILAGADNDDEEDVAIRQALFSTLREQQFERFLAEAVARSGNNASTVAA